MKFPLKQLLGSLCILAVTFSAQGEVPKRMGNFDFAYEISGESKLRPLQVFDNGSWTFFQFRAGEAIPAIFASQSGAMVMLLPEVEGLYTKVPGVSNKYALKIGVAMGEVIHTGDRTGQVLTSPASRVSGTNATLSQSPTLSKSVLSGDISYRIALDTNSYAMPIKGDLAEFPKNDAPSTQTGDLKKVETDIPFSVGSSKLGRGGVRLVKEYALEFKPGGSVLLIARNDSAEKQTLADKRNKSVVDLLVASGVPRKAISFKNTDEVLGTAASSAAKGVSLSVFPSSQFAVSAANAGVRHTGFQEVAKSSWRMLEKDQTVQRVLQRWADEAGWRLIWKNGPEIKIVGDAELVRDGFVSAADYLISQSRSFGHRINGKVYSNKVLIISGD